jgi:hypothetical protein
MSTSQPQDFDAVLGGDNAPPRDAVVLGGLEGAELKLSQELRSRHQLSDNAVWQPPAPIDPHRERERLQKIAQGMLNRQIECQFIAPSSYLLDRLTDRGRNDFDRDFRAVSTEQLIRNFPWDKNGRIAIKTAVLLKMYAKISNHGKEQDICLAAIAPDRRGDEQIIRVELTELRAINQTHNWEDAPWLWSDVETPVSEWLGTNRHPKNDENDRAMRSLALLDEGKIEEALGLYGVTLSNNLHQIIGGEWINIPYYSAPTDQNWTDLLVNTLRQSAPWKMPQAVINEERRLYLWASQKKSRQQFAPLLKIAIFPYQHYSRKTCLMLEGDIDGNNPGLIVDDTGSNSRFHDTAWKRSIWVDFESNIDRSINREDNRMLGVPTTRGSVSS